MYRVADIGFKDYLELQKNTQVIRGSMTMGRDRSGYLDILNKEFPAASSVLCVGARHKSEVEDVIRAGYLALGIDLFSDCDEIRVVDMHDIVYEFQNNEFDVGLMVHSLEHSYAPRIVFEGLVKTCRYGALFVVPVLDKPIKNEIVVFDFMTNPSPSRDDIQRDISDVVDAEVSYVGSGNGEIIFSLRWK